MKLKEALSGAPIFRGRLAAIMWLWWSGFLAGDTDYGFVWFFIPDSGAERHHPVIDIVLMVGSVVCLVAGILSLDQYGRASWFAWAPDDARWGDLTRDQVEREPRVSFGHSFKDDIRRLWCRLKL